MLKDTDYFRLWYDRVMLKPSTRRSYASNLTHFDRYMMECGLVEGDQIDFDHFFVDDLGKSWPIDKNFIRDYVVWLSETFKQYPTVAIYAYQALKSFFRTLYAAEMILTDPTDGVHGPKYHRSQKNDRLSVDEAQVMIKVAERQDPFWKRSLVLVYLFLLCPLRGGEVRMLTLDQINFTDGYIRVDRGQRKGPGIVTMPTAVADVLKHYVSHPEFAKVIGSVDAPILRNKYGAPLKYKQLRQEICELADATGINRRITPHVLRHTYASLAKEAGLNLDTIRQQLRHMDPATTLRYVNPSKDDDLVILNNSSMSKMLHRLSGHEL